MRDAPDLQALANDFFGLQMPVGKFEAVVPQSDLSGTHFLNLYPIVNPVFVAHSTQDRLVGDHGRLGDIRWDCGESATTILFSESVWVKK